MPPLASSKEAQLPPHSPKSPRTDDTSSPAKKPNQRKKTKSLAITKSPWSNLRSKFGKGQEPTTPTDSPEFFFIPADSPSENKKNHSQQKTDVLYQSVGKNSPPELSNTRSPVCPPLEFSSNSTRSPEMVDDKPDSIPGTGDNSSTINASFRPNSREASSEEDGEENLSDNASQYSFDRVASLKYYKPRPPTDCTFPTGPAESIYSRTSSILSSKPPLYDLSDVDWETDLEDLSHLEEADLFAELISEANQVSVDFDDASPPVERTKSSTSMHRQLSQKVKREDSVVTFFNETTPKRAKSHLSTISTTVFPIME